MYGLLFPVKLPAPLKLSVPPVVPTAKSPVVAVTVPVALILYCCAVPMAKSPEVNTKVLPVEPVLDKVTVLFPKIPVLAISKLPVCVAGNPLPVACDATPL